MHRAAYDARQSLSYGLLARTNADKRRCVEMLLADEEWAAWSDRRLHAVEQSPRRR
jgi:hypothetical protein